MTEDEYSQLYVDSEVNLSFADYDSEVLPDNDLDPSSRPINNGDYVIVDERQLKGHKIHSICEFVNKSGDEFEVFYVNRIYPFFFSGINEINSFEKSKVVSKRPHANPSGGTERKVEVLIFPLALTSYQGLKYAIFILW